MTLLSMIFLHILDDFVLQPAGFLSKGKQRAWWIENAPDPKYRHDYLIVLFMHSFSWTFMIMLPLAWLANLKLAPLFFICFAANLFLHGFIDHVKANLLKINLVQDQFLHLIQIFATLLVLTS